MGPLAGIRVLDLTTVGPGARCAAMLADLGAEIVRVGPPLSAQRIVPEPWAYGAGRGVRRIGIDLKDPAGRDACLALAATCDAVLEGFRPGVADRLGIGFEDVRTVRGDVVYASLTGYGQDGPYAQWAGHDLNYQAVSGALATAGRREDGGPALPGATFADSAGGGMHAALSICAALVARDQARMRGEDPAAVHLDVAAVDGMLALMSLTVDEHLATGQALGPADSVLSGRYACYDVYRCRDDRWVSVGAIEPKFWSNLCRELGLSQWTDRQYDDEVQGDVRADVASVFATRDRDEWVASLGPADTCVAPVLDIDEVAGHPHLDVRGAFVPVQVGEDTHLQTARVLAGADRPDRERGAPPDHSDARALLTEAGMTGDDIDKLLHSEVVQ